MTTERFEILLISVCADGATVNMGRVNGACIQLKSQRAWLIVTHCSNHRLELVVSDAFSLDNSFNDLNTQLADIFRLFRNSGKAKRVITQLAIRMNVMFVNFPKPDDTRFSPHKYNAIKAMIINFLPLMMFAENALESDDLVTNEMKMKLRGYLRKWSSYKHLAAMHFYCLVFFHLAHVSYQLQSEHVLITDVLDCIDEAKEKITELRALQNSLPFSSQEVNDSHINTVSATNVPATLQFKERMRVYEGVDLPCQNLTLKVVNITIHTALKSSFHLSANHGVKLNTLALTIFKLENQQNNIRTTYKNVALILFF